MKLKKYHGLGNDYLVTRLAELGTPTPAEAARQVCDRHKGVGSDGLLLGPLPSQTADFRLRIFNPDGSEAEKSGNGIRIFCRFLYDEGLVDQDTPFSLETLGGKVGCVVMQGGDIVRVEMGAVSFWSEDAGITGEGREVIRERLPLPDAGFTVCGASVGNPHCIVLDSTSPETDVHRFGPLIERHPWFKNRTNVQFLTVIDRGNIALQIWERGAGYTTASGSSSVAASAVAHKLGLCDASIKVHMPGGSLDVSFDAAFHAVMTGPVEFVCTAVTP